MKNRILYIVIVSLTTACSDTPSDLGKEVQNRLLEKKESFESLETKERFDRFLSNNKALSQYAKNSAIDAFLFAQNLSAILDPNRARGIIESGEMAIACTIKMLKEKEKVDLFLDNLMQSVTNIESKLVLLEQIEEARSRVANSVINKKNCL